MINTDNRCNMCGKALPEGAAFCPHCAGSQIKKSSARTAKPWRKKLLICFAVVFVLALAAFGLYKKFGPQTYEGGASVLYTDENGEQYNVYLKFFGEGQYDKFTPDEDYFFQMTCEEISSAPSRVYVAYNDSFDVREKFRAQVKDITVESVPTDGGEALVCEIVEETALASNALISAEYLYTYKNKTNDIRWTVNMNNGDKIILTHTVTMEEVPLVHIYPEDYPMNTIKELRALFDKLETEYPPNTSIAIHLPAVTYDGGFIYDTRAYNLFGSREGDAVTTFTGNVTVSNRNPTLAFFDGIRFKGDGTESIGLTMTTAAVIDNCIFEDHAIGLNVTDGGWAIVEGCEFLRNGIGINLNNPGISSASSNSFAYCSFEKNGTAISFKQLPFTDNFIFTETKFIGNDTDIINYTDCTLDLSGATFK